MRVVSKYLLAPVLMILAIEVSVACSACIRDIMSPAEYDTRAWDYAEHVFIGLVTSSELILSDTATDEVHYRVEAEEIFKGEPSAVHTVFSRKPISTWNAEIEEVTCGELSISAGDRVLLFSRPDGSAFLGICSASRVIEGVSAENEPAIESTILRLRQWQASANATLSEQR